MLAQYTRSSKRLKRNPRVCGVHVLAGVGKGKVLLWEYIDRRQWSGAVAAEMYKEPVKQCVEKAYPDLSKRTVLADNDPTGEEAGIKVLQIPMRSPQLNLRDEALWEEVEKHMRSQVKRFAPSSRESRFAFLKRLRRPATRLPTAFINNYLKDMTVRCQRMVAAGGGHIEEGR